MRGTVRSRGPGRWQVQAYAGRDPRTGARRFRAATVHGTEADADRRLRQLIDEVEASRETTGDDLTMAELLARWQTYRGPDWSPAYRVEVRRILELHALPVIGDQLVRRVRPADLDALYAEARAKGLGASRVATLHRRLHTALGQAVRWDIIATNPAARATPPRERPTEITPPTADEMRKALLEAEASPRLFAFLRLAAATGARRAEVCTLQWGDVDLETGVVTFARGQSRGDDGWVVKRTKTDRARAVAIDTSTAAAVAAWQTVAEGQHRLLEVEPVWVFPSWRHPDRPVPPDHMTHEWGRLRRRAGLDHVRLHDLRHFLATQALAAGHDVRTVGGRLGHADATQTLKRYGHFMPAADRALADDMAKVLDG